MLDVKIDYHERVPINVCVSRIHEQPVHSHNDDLELIVLLRGSIKAIIGYTTILLKEGETLILNDRDIHGLYQTEEDNLVLTVHINLRYFRKYNKASYDSFFLMAATYLNDEPYDEPVEEMKSFLFNLSTLMLDRNTSDDTLEVMCADFLDFLLNNFQYFYCSAAGSRHFINRYEGKNNQAQAFRMRSLMYYLWDNYDQKITLKEYADETFINMYYLSHIIKTSTGLNFQDLLNFTRVEQSEILLLETDRKISQIALDCGFSATRYYEKYFKLWFQMSPEEYRRRNMRRLTIPFDETPLDSSEALSAINDYSSRGRAPSKERTSFYTDVIEIDVARKSHKRKDPFLSIFAWDYDNHHHDDHFDKDLQKLQSSFRFCAPIRDSQDLNDRLMTFLQEDDSHALLLTSDYISLASNFANQYIDDLVDFLRSSHISHINIYISLPNNIPAKKVRKNSEMLIRKGKEADCRITIKEYLHCRFDYHKRSYFLDSIYAVPWIIHNSLRNGHSQEVVSTIYDNYHEYRRQLNGGCGIITDSGIRKPSYYAYQLLSMLGKDIIYDSEDYIVTRKGNDIICLFYDYDPEMIRKIDDYSDWKRLSVLRFAARRSREYKLDILNLEGKYNVTEIRLDNECCIFCKMTDLGMPGVISVEDEKLLRDYLKPAVKFSYLDGHKESSVFDIQVPRFGALCLKFHQIVD